MTNKFISLKTSCRNRYRVQINQSVTEKVFSLHNFRSPDFLEALVFPHYDNLPHSDKPSFASSDILLTLICEAEEIFDSDHKKSLDDLQSRFIERLVGMYTNVDDTEELQTMRVALKKCHQRVLESGLDSHLIDEFSKLLHKYDRLEEKRNHLEQDRTTEARKMIETMKRKLPTFPSTAYETNALGLEWLEIQGMDIKRKTKPRHKHILKVLPLREGNTNSGIAFSIKSYNYFIQTTSTVNYNKEIRVLDLKHRRALSCRMTGECTRMFLSRFRDSDFYQIIPSKNLAFNISMNNHKHYTLTLFRISPKRMAKIAAINLQDFLTQDITFIEVLDPHFILAIASETSLSLVNLLTRKTLRQYHFPRKIYKFKYIPDTRLLVIAFSNEVVVYNVSDPTVLLETKLRCSTKEEREPQMVIQKANITLFYYDKSSELLSKNDFCYIFYLFQVNQAGIKEFKANTNDRGANFVGEPGELFWIKSLNRKMFIKSIIICYTTKTIKLIYRNQKNVILRTGVLPFEENNNHNRDIEEDTFDEWEQPLDLEQATMKIPDKHFKDCSTKNEQPKLSSTSFFDPSSFKKPNPQFKPTSRIADGSSDRLNTLFTESLKDSQNHQTSSSNPFIKNSDPTKYNPFSSSLMTQPETKTSEINSKTLPLSISSFWGDKGQSNKPLLPQAVSLKLPNTSLQSLFTQNTTNLFGDVKSLSLGQSQRLDLQTNVPDAKTNDKTETL